MSLAVTFEFIKERKWRHECKYDIFTSLQTKLAQPIKWAERTCKDTTASEYELQLK